IPYDQLAALSREAIDLGVASDGVEGETLGYFVLGRALQELGQQREARAMWEKGIQVARDTQTRYVSSELLPEVEWMGCIWRIGSSLFFADSPGGQAWAVDAVQGWQLAERFEKTNNRADASVILGHARAGMNQLAAAATAYQQAVSWYTKLGDVSLASEPQAGLAQLAMEQGDHVQAHALVETLLPTLAEHQRAGVHTPFYAYLVCYRVLEANGDRRSTAVVQLAQQGLQACASQIADAALRRSFLENVATHRELLQAARALPQ